VMQRPSIGDFQSPYTGSNPVGVAMHFALAESARGPIATNQLTATSYRTGVWILRETPLVRAAVGGDDHGAGAVAFGKDLVGVTALLGVHGVETEVVDDEDICGEELSQLDLVGGGEASVLEGLEHAIGAEGEDGVSLPASGLTEGMRGRSFPRPPDRRRPDADGSR
jgi:hypothetical protein